jgi:hypothetical protein
MLLTDEKKPATVNMNIQPSGTQRSNLNFSVPDFHNNFSTFISERNYKVS